MSAKTDRQEASQWMENDSSVIGAASSMTFNMGIGADDATNRYLNIIP